MQRKVLYLANVSAKRNYLQNIYFMKEKKSQKSCDTAPLKPFRGLCAQVFTLTNCEKCI